MRKRQPDQRRILLQFRNGSSIVACRRLLESTRDISGIIVAQPKEPEMSITIKNIVHNKSLNEKRFEVETDTFGIQVREQITGESGSAFLCLTVDPKGLHVDGGINITQANGKVYISMNVSEQKDGK